MTAPRKYDHDEAKRLRENGWSYYAIAKHFNVSVSSIRRATDPEARERHNEYARKSRAKLRPKLLAKYRAKHPPRICPDCGRERCRINHDLWTDITNDA